MGKRLALAIVCAVALVLLIAPVAMAIRVDSLTPSSALAGRTVVVTVHGSFHAPAGPDVRLPQFSLTGPATISGVTQSMADDGSSANVSFDVPGWVDGGVYAVQASQDWTPIQSPGRSWVPAGRARSSDIVENVVLEHAFFVIYPPVASGVSPSFAVAGSSALTVTIMAGPVVPQSESTSGSYVYLDTGSGPTSMILESSCTSTNQLQATIPAAALATAGTFKLRVMNPGDPALGVADYGSNDLTFSVTDPHTTPVITAIDPPFIWAGYFPDVFLKVTASGLEAGAKIYIDDEEQYTQVWPTWENSVYAKLTREVYAQPRQLLIKLRNPPYHASSKAVSLLVKEETTAPEVQVRVPGEPGEVHNTPVVVTVTADDAQSGLSTGVEWRVPGLVDIRRTAMLTRVGVSYETTFTVPLGTGTYTPEVVVRDLCGHETTATATVQMKRIYPLTLPLADVTGKKGTMVTLPYRVKERADISPTVDVTIRVFRADGSPVANILQPKRPVNTDLKAKLVLSAKFPPGNYHWKVFAVDQWGSNQIKPMAKRLIVTAP